MTRETKYHNYHAAQEAVAEVTLQTCYQTQKKTAMYKRV